MKLKNEFQPIRDWRESRGLNGRNASAEVQMVKLQEEFDELVVGIENNDTAEIADAIGDMVVVLTGIAELKGLTIENCVNMAYDEIKKRKGVMHKGTFIKMSDVFHIPVLAPENDDTKNGPYYLIPKRYKEVFKTRRVIQFYGVDRLYDVTDIGELDSIIGHARYGDQLIMFLQDLQIKAHVKEV
jgi:NTP pyrophosphatase (non-canonical NTP hydrolase)